MPYDVTIDKYPVTIGGYEYILSIYHDTDHGAPWLEEDGHGPVSDWTARDKGAGERVLIASMGGELFLYYDFKKAVKMARDEGWDTEPYDAGETKGQRAHKAAEADFKRLRDWCLDRWHYVGIVLRRADAGCAHCAPTASLWGIESDSGEAVFYAIAEDLAHELEGN